ncbi:hypothetical protein EMIHUDRAFT_197460 [Emiliania huxleyi CCMP1516]|uniref:rRNA adenine N(6)-methyltransferase n=2 Tax=Emiliania huxleyi TaxID=2903 RepID=A0A0D3IUC7_EMIH1|nr:hypothetical protein EMIHUDRAFT_197460 [Emiliania huxleyi CCMP1516]EOD14862.1 hypothetical protein EMIHUDRAFT_197460 [Emiliania huxleyi CCMP1516]|eukprot:XP_005767291.1 hypothetical protein EMIHUDRAFT_197460 [Emiliania huxleyi CCMP1516]
MPKEIKLQHSLGQHLLKNPLVTAAMIEKASIKSTDVVLEIGPGTGNLTLKLLEAAKKALASAHRLAHTNRTRALRPAPPPHTARHMRRSREWVVAVEHDGRMVVELQKRLHGTAEGRRLQLIHADVMKVLEETGFAEERTAKLDQDDFLRLLAAFNAVGIHFAGC